MPELTIDVTMERRAAEALALELKLLAAAHGLSVKDVDIAVERQSRPRGKRADRADYRKPVETESVIDPAAGAAMLKAAPALPPGGPASIEA